MSVKTYDSRCLDLAKIFLEDNPKIDANRAHLLALHIQGAIEDWIEFEEVKCDFCGEPRGRGNHADCVLF